MFEVSFVEKKKILKVFLIEINMEKTGFYSSVEGCYLPLYLIFF